MWWFMVAVIVAFIIVDPLLYILSPYPARKQYLFWPLGGFVAFYVLRVRK